MKRLFFLIIIISISVSCKKTEVIKMELNPNQIIPAGEWISFSDSLSGLSIRKDKIAFYKNNKFNGEDVCDYNIIDSLKSDGSKKITLSSYLKTINLNDTIYYKITNRDNFNISLTLKDNKTESYELKKK